MKKRKWLTVALAALLLLSALFLLSSCKEKQTPFEFLADAYEKSAQETKTEAAEIFEQAMKSGSMDFSLNADASLGIPLSSITMKSYLGEEKAASLLSLTDLDGQTLSATIFESKTDAILTSSALESAYGVPTARLNELLSMLYEDIEAGDAFEETLLDTDQLENAVLTISSKANELFEKYAVAVSTEKDGLVLVTIELSGENVGLYLCDLIEAVRDDPACYDALEALLALDDSIDLEASFEAYNREEMLAECAASPVTLQYEVSATTKKIIKSVAFSLTYEDDNDGFAFSYQTDENGSFSLSVTDSEDTSYTVGWEVEESEEKYQAELSIGTTGMSLKPLSVTFDKEAETYKLQILIPGTFSASVEGVMRTADSELTFTVDSIKVSVTDESNFGFAAPAQEIGLKLSLTVKATDTMPTAPSSYQNLLELDEDAQQTLLEELMADEVLVSLLELLSSAE